MQRSLVVRSKLNYVYIDSIRHVRCQNIHLCVRRPVFTARQHAMLSAVLAIVNPSVRPSVCPSVCPSQSGTVSKRLKLGSWDLHWRIAP